jgi:deoxyribodipyrimidine photo-lyase
LGQSEQILSPYAQGQARIIIIKRSNVSLPTNKQQPTIVWFRQDLRIADNPALWHACQQGIIIPIYILDDQGAQPWSIGGAGRWWLHQALQSLDQILEGKLNIFRGEPFEILQSLADEFGAKAIFWNRCYEPWRIERDAKLKDQFKRSDVEVKSFNGSLLWEPWQIVKKDQTPYKVFTPYYRRGCLPHSEPREPLAVPSKRLIEKKSECSLTIEDLSLMPSINWYRKIAERWQVTECVAHKRLQEFVETGLGDYREGRNYPSQRHVSELSPYLHFGLISVNTVWHRARNEGSLYADENNIDTFLSELGWREFSYYLLYHFPQLPSDNLQVKFDVFPWLEDAEAHLSAWQQGQTGYPLIDAGMRELYNTGYMHNRVRMVVGSFLVKNLLIHWHHGHRWFWDCLVDADLASNSASWQWIAGCGADAAPFFRIFNPVTQSKKFDPEGDYIRHYVPELAALPSKYIHEPWAAPQQVLNSAGIELGTDYPHPVVDIKHSRERALAAFKQTASDGSASSQ